MVTAEFRFVRDIPEADIATPAELILIGVDRECYTLADEQRRTNFKGHVERLKHHYPQARLVLLLPKDDISSMGCVLSLNADSYVFNDISPDIMLHYLSLIMMGEKVMPSMLASVDVQKPDASTHIPNAGLLSEREQDIIRHLMLGESNKAIANQLAITDATVKVHLKAILRKLGLKNRTQVALWGVENGLETIIGEKAPENVVRFQYSSGKASLA